MGAGGKVGVLGGAGASIMTEDSVGRLIDEMVLEQLCRR